MVDYPQGSCNGHIRPFVALLGLGLFPVGVNYIIPELGWRNTYILLGSILLLGMVPMGYIFFRDRPEQFGLNPDGYKKTNESDTGNDPRHLEDNWTLRDAILTPSFWVVGGSAGTISMLTTGLIFHLVSIFNDQGLDADAAASVFIPLSITMAVVTLCGGALADRIAGRYILALVLAAQVAVLFMAMHLTSFWFILLFGVTMGLISGLYRVIMSVLWANYFGRLHLGSITGIAQTIAVGGSALGPLPLGIAHDMFGNYQGVFLWCTILPLIFGIANIFVGKPRRSLAVSG